MTMIADILKFPKGAAVQNLTATVTNAYPPRSGEGQYGPWTVMDLDLVDDAGDTIKANWWYCMVDDPAHIKGQRVTISATPDKAGTLKGANVDHHEYKGKTTIRVKINGDRLQFATPESSNAGNGTPATTPTGRPGTLTLSAYLSATGRAYRYAINVLGISDQVAAVAYSNTAGIAASQGRLIIDTVEEPADDTPPPF